VRAVGWLYTGSAEGARSLLSTVAGAVVTVVGVAFSVTIVSLQLAAAQLGPRVLRNFMRDRGNQVVLGTFVATFVYCLLVLRTVRGTNGLAGDEFIPHLAVTGGVALAIFSAAVLIYFIHHAAVGIQADHVIAVIAHELDDTVDTLYPDRLGDAEAPADAPPPLPEDFERTARVIAAPTSGYVRSIGEDPVMSFAAAHDVLVRLECRPGDLVLEGEPRARAWPPGRVDDAAAARLAATIAVGRVRTLVQDFRFGVEQLVEIAVRALSSDLRDPTTAIRCIDRLDDGRLRVIAPSITMDEVVAGAFGSIRARGAESLAVALHLLETFERVARLRDSRELHAALLAETAKMERGSPEALGHPWERRAITHQAARVRRALRPDVLAGPDSGPLPPPTSRAADPGARAHVIPAVGIHARWHPSVSPPRPATPCRRRVSRSPSEIAPCQPRHARPPRSLIVSSPSARRSRSRRPSPAPRPARTGG
jgi:uncharacterized membrane protein